MDRDTRGLSLTGIAKSTFRFPTPTLCGLRLRRLQQLVRSSNLDGLLLVPGLDGRYNAGSHQALAYLLEGRSGRDVLDVNRLQAAVEEAVILVRPHGLSVFTASPTGPDGSALAGGTAGGVAALRELLLRMRAGPLESFAPTAAEEDDPDELEEAKIGAFVSMLHGLRKLGVAAMSDIASGTPVSILPPGPALMALERWPLLQAYGLEGVGRGGFFTMNFEVHDVHGALLTLYGVMDSRQLQQLLGERATALAQHWGEAVQGLGARVASGNAAEVTERQVAEPLLGFFSYGLIRPVAGVSQTVTMRPRCIFGARTGDEAAVAETLALGAAAGAASSQQPALHFVLEGADARSALRVARTYFLSNGCLTTDAFADLEEEREEGYSYEAATAGWTGPANVLYIMRLYCCLVGAAHAAMTHFATQDGATVHTARQAASDELSAAAVRHGVQLPAAPAQCVRFAMWECDHADNIRGMAERGSRYLKVVRLSLVGCTAGAGGDQLGGVVYADTFIDIPEGLGQPASLLVLTDAVPPLLAFSALGPEATVARRAADSFARFAAEAAEELAYAAHGGAGGPARAAAAATRRRQRALSAAASRPKPKQAVAVVMAVAINGNGGVEEEEEAKQEEEEDEEPAAAADDVVSAERPAAAAQLGALLTIGGGDDVVLLTGCTASPSLAGTLHCLNGGFAFTHAATKALWIVDFSTDVERIVVQELLPKQAASPRSSVGPSTATTTASSLGQAVVFVGRRPACGLPPVCHLSSDVHLVLPLASMAPGARKALLTTVLPVWSRSAAAAGMTYTKDPWASSPLPSHLSSAHAHAVSLAGTDGKDWSATYLADARVEEALERLDYLELSGGLCQLPAAVEGLLTRGPSPGSLPVTLVVGAPGADHAQVVACVSGMLGDNTLGAGPGHRVVLLPAGLTGATSLRPQDLDSALASALPADGQCSHIVLATACFDGTVAQLAVLAATQAVTGGRLQLACVVACVNVDGAWEERARGRVAPGVLELLAPGVVDVVALMGKAAADATAEVQSLVQHLCPGAVVLRGRQQLSRARSDLLPNSAERAEKLQASAALRRCWAGGPATSPQRLARGPLQVARVAWKGAIDMAKLSAQLATGGLGVVSNSAAGDKLALEDVPLDQLPQWLLGASGVLRSTAGAAAAQEVVAVHGAALQQRDSTLAGLPISHGEVAALAAGGSGGELAFLGTGLRPNALAALIMTCACTATAPTEVCTVATLSAAERASVAKAHLLDPLPDDHYFDGTQFLDPFGDRSAHHPNLPLYLQQYVEQKNAAREHSAAATADADAVRMGGEPLQVLLAELC